VETNWICRPGCYLYTVAQRAYQGGPGSRLNLPQARSKPKWLPVGPFRITSHGTLFGLERAKKRRVGSLTSFQNMRCQMGRAVDHAEMTVVRG
jgi:hypothetical protein